MANPSEHVNHSFSARFHDFSRDAGKAARVFAGRVYQVLISVKNFILTAIQNLYNLYVGTRPPGNQQRGNQNAIGVPLQTRVPTPGTSPTDERQAEIRDNLVRKLSHLDQNKIFSYLDYSSMERDVDYYRDLGLKIALDFVRVNNIEAISKFIEFLEDFHHQGGSSMDRACEEIASTPLLDDRASLIISLAELTKGTKHGQDKALLVDECLKYDVDTLNKASTLLKKLNGKFESLSYRGQILQAVADIAPEEREDVIDKACPLIQEGASSYNIAQILKGIAAITKDQRQEKIEFAFLYLRNLPEKNHELLFALAIIPLDQLDNFRDKITRLSDGLTFCLPLLIKNIADIYVKDSKFLEDICSNENMLLLMNQFTSGAIRAEILNTVEKLDSDKRQGAIEKTLQVLDSKSIALIYSVDFKGLLQATASISNDDWKDVFSKTQELLANNQGPFHLPSALEEALVLSAIAFIPKELREQALVFVKSLNHPTISKVALIHAIASLTAVVAPEHFGAVYKQLKRIYSASEDTTNSNDLLKEVAKAIFNKESDPSFIASSVAHSLKYMEEGKMPYVAIEALSKLFEGLNKNDPHYARYSQLREKIGHNKDLHIV